MKEDSGRTHKPWLLLSDGRVGVETVLPNGSSTNQADLRRFSDARQLCMAQAVGFEPTAHRLTAGCSAAELRRTESPNDCLSPTACSPRDQAENREGGGILSPPASSA